MVTLTNEPAQEDTAMATKSTAKKSTPAKKPAAKPVKGNAVTGKIELRSIASGAGGTGTNRLVVRLGKGEEAPQVKFTTFLKLWGFNGGNVKTARMLLIDAGYAKVSNAEPEPSVNTLHCQVGDGLRARAGETIHHTPIDPAAKKQWKAFMAEAVAFYAKRIESK
jgi:hypothetical protein